MPPESPRRPSRALSGIQPTGRFHWGNYFGAIRQYIDLQPAADPAAARGAEAVDEAYYFIADLHALTTVRDPARLRTLVHAAAVDLVALGLDPVRAVLFVQSDVPEVTELTWLLMTVTPMGLLERCHAYKDKKTRGLPADAGLFTYPVLMAADILAYDATVVPVGEDQVQHIEVCRDLADKFNSLYGDVFMLPQPRLVVGGAKVPGTDGQKMSKSYGNTVDLFGEDKDVKKKIMSIRTDSTPVEAPKPTADAPLYDLLKLMAPTPADFAEVERAWREGGRGYGDFKKKLLEWFHAQLDGPRARRQELLGDWGHVERVLADGAQRARATATPVLQAVKRAAGL